MQYYKTVLVSTYSCSLNPNPHMHSLSLMFINLFISNQTQTVISSTHVKTAKRIKYLTVLTLRRKEKKEKNLTFTTLTQMSIIRIHHIQSPHDFPMSTFYAINDERRYFNAIITQFKTFHKCKFRFRIVFDSLLSFVIVP